MNVLTRSTSVWRTIYSLQGKGENSAPAPRHLQGSNLFSTQFADIANSIAFGFSKHLPLSYSTHYFLEHLIKIIIYISHYLDFVFSFLKLLKVLMRYLNNFLSIYHHSHYCLYSILIIIFEPHINFVSANVVITGFPFAGKDHTNPADCRPISLTSCICKTLKGMINSRFVCFLESYHLLPYIQCGFQQNRNYWLSSVLRKLYPWVFAWNEHVVTILCDLEKAYDTTCKYWLFKDCRQFGFRNHISLFIQQFLQNCSFPNRIGQSCSD